MTDAQVRDFVRARQVAQVARELEHVSRAMASNCMTVELALARRDWITAHDGAEVVIDLAERFRELRRHLLALGVRGIGV